jgi:hypothetical protein
MVEADDVRRVGLALPRSYEAFIGRRWKLKVRQLVYVAFSRDETSMGFGFPKVERDGLVASDPETFFLPPTSDLRYQWVCARLDRLGQEEMRELVTDAWRMCVPRMLHVLADLPRPTAAAWSAIEDRDWVALRPLLHPYLHWHDRSADLCGRSKVLAHLESVSTPRPPSEVEIRDGQIYRWGAGAAT